MRLYLRNQSYFHVTARFLFKEDALRQKYNEFFRKQVNIHPDSVEKTPAIKKMTELPDIFQDRKEIIDSVKLGSLNRVDIGYIRNLIEQPHIKGIVKFPQPTICEEAERFTP